MSSGSQQSYDQRVIHIPRKGHPRASQHDKQIKLSRVGFRTKTRWKQEQFVKGLESIADELAAVT